jgi:hypothetical protein
VYTNDKTTVDVAIATTKMKRMEKNKRMTTDSLGYTG